jgi:c-di-GMP phosphodiesterase
MQEMFMYRFRETVRFPALTTERNSLTGRSPWNLSGEHAPELRQFALQPIVGLGRQEFGSEALFRSGWEDIFTGEPSTASRIMLDNWLLYGLDEMIARRPVFLNCTRETLISGDLALLPRSAVLEVLESVTPDQEVLAACWSLRAAGYRFALDDFEASENMHGFLALADFIKVDFRRSGRRERARMLPALRQTGATLIAEKIESEQEFLEAVEEAFTLFQGYWTAEQIHYANQRDHLDLITCLCLLQALEEPGFDVDALAALVSLDSGIECRLLRRANWISPAGAVIDLTQDALAIVGKTDLQRIVTLAMNAGSDLDAKSRTIPYPSAAMRDDADVLVRWMETGAQTPWWYQPGRRIIH